VKEINAAGLSTISTGNRTFIYKTGLFFLVASICVVFLGPIGSRIGWWDYYFAVTLFKWAAMLAASFVMIVGGMLLAKGSSRKKAIFISLTFLVLAIPVLATLLYWKKAKQTYPPIQDISTDLFEPPEFWYAPNVKVYNPLAIADMQMEAYPDVEPAVLTLPFDQAFNLIHEIVQDTGWEILAVEPENGRIEATDTTFWFGFSDDVVIRVTREGESSTIDIRSTSRFGSGGDGGTNAKRILRLLKELDRRISVT
jgi:uncharacterized protein (DUF1499 family)